MDYELCGGERDGSPPGPDRWASLDLAGLDDQARIDALIALERQRSRIDALQQQVLSLISSADRSAEQWHVEEVGAALRLSGPAARNRLKAAEQLCASGCLPRCARSATACSRRGKPP